MEEHKVKEAKKKEEKEIFDKITKSAILIQSLWRGYRLRKGLNRKVKKKNKKKN